MKESAVRDLTKKELDKIVKKISKEFNITTARLFGFIHISPTILKRIRASKNLTQIQFAKALSVSIWSIRSWEQGKRPIPHKMVVKLNNFDLNFSIRS